MSTGPDSWHCPGRTVDPQVQMVHEALNFFYLFWIPESFCATDGYYYIYSYQQIVNCTKVVQSNFLSAAACFCPKSAYKYKTWCPMPPQSRF